MMIETVWEKANRLEQSFNESELNPACPTCEVIGKPVEQNSNIFKCVNQSCNTLVFDAGSHEVIHII